MLRFLGWLFGGIALLFLSAFLLSMGGRLISSSSTFGVLCGFVVYGGVFFAGIYFLFSLAKDLSNEFKNR